MELEWWMFVSTWVMMNQDTRRLSKMPQEVLAEISPFFLGKTCIKNDPCQKIQKLNDTAPYSRPDLVVKKLGLPWFHSNSHL
jgi:fatty acyl-ACP thioesterase B